LKKDKILNSPWGFANRSETDPSNTRHRKWKNVLPAYKKINSHRMSGLGCGDHGKNYKLQITNYDVVTRPPSLRAIKNEGILSGQSSNRDLR